MRHYRIPPVLENHKRAKDMSLLFAERERQGRRDRIYFLCDKQFHTDQIHNESQPIRHRRVMEGVGARLGRSSTRYGPATVFNGPVRKWKKRWVHVSPSNSNNNNNHSHSYNGTTPPSTSASSNGNNGSHLLLYKWTPISQSTNNNINGNNSNGDKISSKDEAVEATDENPRRKFKYIPVAVLEEQKNEAAEKIDDDDAKPIDTDPSDVEPTTKSEDFDEKPDINDLPTEESQSEENNQVVRQDLNESTLDLSLGR